MRSTSRVPETSGEKTRAGRTFPVVLEFAGRTVFPGPLVFLGRASPEFQAEPTSPRKTRAVDSRARESKMVFVFALPDVALFESTAPKS